MEPKRMAVTSDLRFADVCCIVEPASVKSRLTNSSIQCGAPMRSKVQRRHVDERSAIDRKSETHLESQVCASRLAAAKLVQEEHLFPLTGPIKRVK